MKTSLTELLGIQYPIIQGAMAWTSEHTLAAAVANAGATGVLGCPFGACGTVIALAHAHNLTCRTGKVLCRPVRLWCGGRTVQCHIVGLGLWRCAKCHV